MPPKWAGRKPPSLARSVTHFVSLRNLFGCPPSIGIERWSFTKVHLFLGKKALELYAKNQYIPNHDWIFELFTKLHIIFGIHIFFTTKLELNYISRHLYLTPIDTWFSSVSKWYLPRTVENVFNQTTERKFFWDICGYFKAETNAINRNVILKLNQATMFIIHWSPRERKNGKKKVNIVRRDQMLVRW
jgi:hypothetical protein